MKLLTKVFADSIPVRVLSMPEGMRKDKATNTHGRIMGKVIKELKKVVAILITSFVVTFQIVILMYLYVW